MRPLPNTFPSYFNTYIKLIPEGNVSVALTKNLSKAEAFFNLISEEQSQYSYANGKWTVKEILQHIIDAERIFCYRALSITRKEPATLPSFDENKYAANSLANNRSWNDLTKEFQVVRQSSILLFNSFTNEKLECIGNISDYTMSVLALGYTIAGHTAHHIQIIRERYLDIDFH
ncbi:MAG: DinB family protein [Ginsengibacter sp.]